jgi:hypothetical protein
VGKAVEALFATCAKLEKERVEGEEQAKIDKFLHSVRKANNKNQRQMLQRIPDEIDMEDGNAAGDVDDGDAFGSGGRGSRGRRTTVRFFQAPEEGENADDAHDEGNADNAEEEDTTNANSNSKSSSASGKPKRDSGNKFKATLKTLLGNLDLKKNKDGKSSSDKRKEAERLEAEEKKRQDSDEKRQQLAEKRWVGGNIKSSRRRDG